MFSYTFPNSNSAQSKKAKKLQFTLPHRKWILGLGGDTCMLCTYTAMYVLLNYSCIHKLIILID